MGVFPRGIWASHKHFQSVCTSALNVWIVLFIWPKKIVLCRSGFIEKCESLGNFEIHAKKMVLFGAFKSKPPFHLQSRRNLQSPFNAVELLSQCICEKKNTTVAEASWGIRVRKSPNKRVHPIARIRRRKGRHKDHSAEKKREERNVLDPMKFFGIHHFMWGKITTFRVRANRRFRLHKDFNPKNTTHAINSVSCSKENSGGKKIISKYSNQNEFLLCVKCWQITALGNETTLDKRILGLAWWRPSRVINR